MCSWRQYDRIGHPKIQQLQDILTEKPTCGNKEISLVQGVIEVQNSAKRLEMVSPYPGEAMG